MTLQRMSMRAIVFLVAVIVPILLGGVSVGAAEPASDSGSYQIAGITAQEKDQGLVLRIEGSASPTYTAYELFDPFRVVVDIADAVFAETVHLPMTLPADGGTVNGRVLTDRTPPLVRLEVLLAADREFVVERQEQDIVITLQEVAMTAPASAAPESPGSAIVTDLLKQEQQADQGAPAAPVPATDSSSEEFAYSGYNKMPISVDFYKIDLHNVFRLFGEISGMNIVVAEGVGGSLTLALNNVPWDFALDVILNLKDLQKIERYDTIVIAPKSQEFKWEKKAADNLEVRKSLTVVKERNEGAAPTSGEAEGQGVSVRQRDQLSPEMLAAKKLEREGRSEEKSGNLDAALGLYEKAFAKWPGNSRLASRMASLFLVHKGMNAKAVHYAKAALQADAKDRDAALFAGIGLANMKKVDAAREFFDLAVQTGSDGSPPDSEALVSYAVFNEENGNNMGALLLLGQHEELYGDTLETMIAKARIYDKEGNSAKAVAEYQAILLSGYELPPDLARYINGRLTLEEKGQQLKK